MAPDPSPALWLALFLLGGLVAADDTAWPQAMVSRPVVAAALGGWLAGDAAVGLAVGAVLELLLLPHLPLGGARCPDPGPASLVAGAAGAAAGPSVAVVLSAALLGWMLSWLGEVTVRWQRRLTGRLVGDAAEEVREPRALERRHLAGLATDFLRGGVLAAVCWVPATLAVRVSTTAVTVPADAALVAAFALGAAGAGVGAASASRAAVRVAAPAAAAVLAALVWWVA